MSDRGLHALNKLRILILETQLEVAKELLTKALPHLQTREVSAVRKALHEEVIAFLDEKPKPRSVQE